MGTSNMNLECITSVHPNERQTPAHPDNKRRRITNNNRSRRIVDPKKKRTRPDAAASSVLAMTTNLPASDSPADVRRLVEQHVTDALGEIRERIIALTSQVGCLKKENERLHLRCESLERSVQALSGDGNWTYSAPDVPESHWIDQGHNEDYAEEAEILIQSIETTTRGLRSGEDRVLLHNCNHTILSDGAMHPHWEQLANAIQLSKRITKFWASNIQLDQRALRMIEASLRQKGVTNLHLHKNRFIGGEGVQFAVNVLNGNGELDQFSWSNTIHSEEDALELVDAVLEHPKISDVSFCSDLSAPEITYSLHARLFRGLLYSGRETLLVADLSYTEISTNGDRFIAEFIASNPALTDLDLQGNRLTDNDALDLAEALQWNTNLIRLDIFDNMFTTEEGLHSANYVAIFGVNRADSADINDSKIDLNIVSDANHTCDIVGVTEGLRNNEDASGKWNRGVKLFFLLGRRHSAGDNMIRLESEFAGDGAGIVPHVLGFINSYANIVNSNEVEMDDSYFDWLHPNIDRLYRQNDRNESYRFNLTLLFELARGWKTPEIYQFLQE